MSSAVMPHALPKRLLVRDYIQKSLYDPIQGYFSNAKPPVLQHDKRPPLREIPTRAEYQNSVATAYASAQHGWMTPIELFSPFLSRAIAKRIQSVAPTETDIHVIEIGAGRGTLARDMLNYWADTAPQLLTNVSYTIVEISPTLAELQTQVLRPWVDRGIARVHNADAVEWFASLPARPMVWDRLRQAHCHIVGTEVLDNLPHDLVRHTDRGIEQATIVSSNDEPHKATRRLKWEPDIDAETLSAMHAFDQWPSDGAPSAPSRKRSWAERARAHVEQLVSGGASEAWVPTGSFRLVRALAAALPGAHVTVGDFDALPGALAGRNAPVVQRVDRGAAVVYDSVHGAPFGRVDVMFPTDFGALAAAHEALGGAGARGFERRVVGQRELFRRYADERDVVESTCRDGYNPVLQDFENASFLLVDRVAGAGDGEDAGRAA